jgi:hypothetical protein
VIRLAQLQHILAHGSYDRLLRLEAAEARELVAQGDALHNKWVGSKPLNTQYATEEAFARTRYKKDLSEAYKHHYAGGNPYSARLRVTPQNVGKEQGKSHAKHRTREAQTTDIVDTKI